MVDAEAVAWPAFIAHAGDAELTYIGSEADWNNDPELHAGTYADADRLVDSTGAVFGLTRRDTSRVTPLRRGDVLELTDILGLIKAHAAQAGSCCIAKLYAPTLDEAFRLLASLRD